MTKAGNRIQISDETGNEAITIATPNQNTLSFFEQHTASGRPAVSLTSNGDIFLAAAGRIHMKAAYISREVG